jgi:hypothetical protein
LITLETVWYETSALAATSFMVTRFTPLSPLCERSHKYVHTITDFKLKVNTTSETSREKLELNSLLSGSFLKQEIFRPTYAYAVNGINSATTIL